MTRPLSGNPSACANRDGQKMAGERYESFVVRVLVYRDGDIARGPVTDVASGERVHFAQPELVPDLMRRLAVASAARRRSDT